MGWSTRENRPNGAVRVPLHIFFGSRLTSVRTAPVCVCPSVKGGRRGRREDPKLTADVHTRQHACRVTSPPPRFLLAYHRHLLHACVCVGGGGTGFTRYVSLLSSVMPSRMLRMLTRTPDETKTRRKEPERSCLGESRCNEMLNAPWRRCAVMLGVVVVVMRRDETAVIWVPPPTPVGMRDSAM